MAQLDRGRAHFQVSGDPLRTFLVKAGGYDLIARDAAFDVDLRDQKFSVLVIEGHIGARLGSGAAGKMRRIVAGERLRVDGHHAPSIDRPALEPLIAWTSGHALFVDTPLHAAAAEMNRYSLRPIIVADPRLAASPVSGDFDIGDSASFARSAAQQLAVPLRIDAQEILIGRA